MKKGHNWKSQSKLSRASRLTTLFWGILIFGGHFPCGSFQRLATPHFKLDGLLLEAMEVNVLLAEEENPPPREKAAYSNNK